MAINQTMAVQAIEQAIGGKVITASVCAVQSSWLALAETEAGKVLVCVYQSSSDIASLFVKKESLEYKNLKVDVMELNANNAAAVRRFVKWTAPVAQEGKGVSISFSDWLGCAGGFAAMPFKLRQARPVLVEYTPEDSADIKRNFLEAVDAAEWGVMEGGYKEGYGANAAGLKTEEDIVKALLYGYSMIGFDCSDKVDMDIDTLASEKVTDRYNQLPDSFRAAMAGSYLEADFKLGDDRLHFEAEELQRIVLKFGEVIMHTQFIYNSYLKNTPWAIDFELDLSKCGKALTYKELYVLSNELHRNGIKFTGFVLDTEGIEDLKVYGEVADVFGYRLSILNADLEYKDLGSVVKMLKGKAYLKMNSLLWIAALKVVAENNAELFAEIAKCAEVTEGVETLVIGSSEAKVWSASYKKVLNPESGLTEKIKETLAKFNAEYQKEVENMVTGVLKTL